MAAALGIIAVSNAMAADAPRDEAPAAAMSPQAVLRQALSDYEAAVALKSPDAGEARRLFDRAADGFHRLIDTGLSNAALHYNLANAEMRLGRIGRAIVNYRRAERLDPGNDRIQRNLQFARKRCRTPIPPRPLSQFAESVFAWHYRTSMGARLTLALVAYGLFWTLLAVGRFLTRRPPAVVWSTRVVGLLALVLWASVGWESYRRSVEVEGVLIADDVVLRKGYGDNYDPQLDRPLAQGVEVRILATREAADHSMWYYVELPDGKSGYLRKDQCEAL